MDKFLNRYRMLILNVDTRKNTQEAYQFLEYILFRRIIQ